ncbi:cell surface protein [Campylobacter fetus subsp. testudinum]|uniref:beta strand repeat-containing protein n=1 Tax=Campylobacter fetus TaxID=196 RepID=UPI000CFCC441|nr:cell surface protein [Campylobacter fetus]AVK80787.1 cell surface protein [Campylobacter fetus subsp. testudinum]
MLNKTDVSMLYITIMGMASEGDGNKYWLDYANSNSLGVSSLANIMLDSPGAAKFFGDSLLAGNEKEFVTKIYSIALGSTSDVDGINYWTKAITGGGEFTDSKGNVINVASLSKGDLIGAMIDSMVNGGSAESKAIFEAKAAASDYFADATLGKDITGLDEGTTSKLISEITSASDLDKVKGEIDGLKESIDEAGLNKIALTTENDTITGTEGGDLISGVVGTAAESTLNPGDKIDGGAGNDVLKVDLKGNFDGFKGDGYIKNVEKLELSNTTSIGRSFNAKDVAGLKTVALNSEKGIEVKNLANIVDVELTNLKADKFSIDAMYANKVLDSASGVKDTQNLKVNGVGTKDKAVALTAEKIEVLNLNTIGEASFLKDVNVENVSVKGSANLSLTTGIKTTTLDASSFGGALNADLTASTKVTSIKGGNGNDKITVKDFAANAVIDGGAGNDELVIKGTGALKPTVANVEKVTVEAVGGALTLAMDNATGVTELDVKQATGGNITITNSAIETVSFVNNDSETNTVTVNNAGLNTVNFKGGDAKGAATTVKGNITAVKSESLTVNTDALSTIAKTEAVINAANATNISINAEKGTAGMTLTAGKLTDLTVNNKGDFELVGGVAGTLNNVENLTVASEGKFSITTSVTLDKVGNIALSGKEINLANQNIGSDTLSSLAVEVSELSGDLKLGDAGTKVIKAKGDINVNLNSINTATLGNITSSTGNASVIISSATGAVSVGTVSAVNGNVTLNAGDASTSVKAGAISAESVNVDLSQVLGTTTVGKITSDNIVYKASELSADTAGKIELSSKGTTQNFKADVTGSLGNDKIELTTTATTTSSVTLSGDLGAGNDTVEINKAAAVEALKSVNLSGLTNYATSETKLKAAVSDTLTFNGGSGNDHVEVSGTDITSLIITGDFGEGGTDKLTLGTSGIAITGADSAVTIDIKGVTNVDSTEINFTNGAVDMSTKALTINGSNSNDQVTLKLLAATTKVKVDGDLGAGVNSITITPDTAAGTLTSIDLGELKATGGTLTSTITLNAANTAANISIKGSLGGDTITVVSANKAVAIDLGKDTAVDKVDVSAVKIADVTTDEKIAEDLVSITNALSGDKIILTGANAIANRGEITGATLKDAIAKLGASGNGTLADAVAEVFTYKGNTYVLDAADTTLKNDDLIVKLTGIVTFSDVVDANTITVA